MPKYPNQKHLKVNKELIPIYTAVTQLDWIDARKRLTPTAFDLYLWIATNENGYEFDFSPQEVANTGLMDASTARKARKQLEDRGFIEGENFYTRHPEFAKELEKMTTQY